ncbi:hypothetical protein FJT64_015480 [Amphibalanus amphitrite]|uniref:Uncharacterized protein n=1 Tax=Amphibalanus amphitrite TaxID=1232801 RepID=A0A6A4XFI3_AMPAM|nr:hypothetical protein FJT64_015480 [Amphibalanus amphitrite]
MNKTSGRFLSRLPASLRRLSLSGRWKCQPIERLPATSITELDISGLWEPPPAALASLLRMCPRLQRLNAKECSVTDSFVEQLPKRTPGIRDLNLEGWFSIMDYVHTFGYLVLFFRVILEVHC